MTDYTEDMTAEELAIVFHDKDQYPLRWEQRTDEVKQTFLQVAQVIVSSGYLRSYLRATQEQGRIRDE